MKTNIESLVDEALKEMKRPVHIQYHQENLKKILTTLAEKASKNGLQPLPKAIPEWFVTYFNNRGNDAATCWSHMVALFGTKPAEWWHGLKKGDKFVNHLDEAVIFRGVYLHWGTGGRIGNSDPLSVKPYTEPTALEQFMATLTPEQIELAKGLKIEEIVKQNKT